MKITPTEAFKMLQSDDADKFKIGLVNGDYEFDDKYIQKKWRIAWDWWTPYMTTEYIISDGVNELRIK